ncbi:MAG TPA: GNAT family N-acetyltransferase [Cyclobacteriaceae bacterium]|nr:GNAT family N-acetyltransferase [Cyclobacteriaceae bacterium]
MNIDYQPYSPQYAAEFQSLVQGLYDHSPEGQPMKPGKVEATIEYLTRNPDKGNIILFLRHDIVVGYSIIIPYWSNEYGGQILFVDELFVKEEYRSQKIGSHFLQHLFQKKAEGFKAILLEVFPSNTLAYSFYARNGFEPNAGKYMRHLLGR